MPRRIRWLLATTTVVATLLAVSGTPALADPTPNLAAPNRRPERRGRGPAGSGETHIVTLLTGDVVTVEATGSGCPRVRVQPVDPAGVIRRSCGADGHLKVIPAKVAAQVGTVLDPDLFDVTTLIADGYDDESTSELPVIVQPAENQRTTALAGLRPLSSIGAVAGAVPKKVRGQRQGSHHQPAHRCAKGLARPEGARDRDHRRQPRRRAVRSARPQHQPGLRAAGLAGRLHRQGRPGRRARHRRRLQPPRPGRPGRRPRRLRHPGRRRGRPQRARHPRRDHHRRHRRRLARPASRHRAGRAPGHRQGPRRLRLRVRLRHHHRHGVGRGPGRRDQHEPGRRHAGRRHRPDGGRRRQPDRADRRPLRHRRRQQRRRDRVPGLGRARADRRRGRLATTSWPTSPAGDR